MPPPPSRRPPRPAVSPWHAPRRGGRARRTRRDRDRSRAATFLPPGARRSLVRAPIARARASPGGRDPRQHVEERSPRREDREQVERVGRPRLLAELQGPSHPLAGHPTSSASSISRGSWPGTLVSASWRPLSSVKIPEQMAGQPQGAAVLRDRLLQRLPDPDLCPRHEGDAAIGIEPLQRAEQADDAVLDEIVRRHATSAVPPRPRLDAANGRLDQPGSRSRSPRCALRARPSMSSVCPARPAS